MPGGERDPYDQVVELIEFRELTSEQYAELVGDETDPWDAGEVNLEWRPKDLHVALRARDGRLIATAGLIVAEVDFGEDQTVPVSGIGGVIVAAPYRGRGFGARVISEAVRRAEELGPELALLFCRPDRAALYRRYGFAEVPGPVLVDQPTGVLEMPLVTMWRPLKDGVKLPDGAMRLRGLPF